MQRVGATGTCERDKHEDRPDDTDMRVLSEPDNMEVQHDCKQVQQEPRSPGKQAVETRSKIEDGVNLEQGSGGGGQERDNQSRNLGSSTHMQQAARAPTVACLTHRRQSRGATISMHRGSRDSSRTGMRFQ